MEYIKDQTKKDDTTGTLDLSKLSGEGELTKGASQMSSFKFYLTKPSAQWVKKEVVDKNKDTEVNKDTAVKKDTENKKKELPKNVSKELLKKPIHKKAIFLFKRVSLTDNMLFMDNMSTMLRAGLSLTPSLKTIRNEIRNKYFKEVLEYLYNHIENGQTLSTGMKHYPKVFPDMVIATVEVGENTGMLSDTFGHLADIMKRQKALRSKVLGAMMYPSIVILALLAVSVFLSMVIFPQLIGLFEASGVKLPFILVAVNAINFTISNYWPYVLGVFVVIIILTKVVFSKPGPKLLWHTALLRVPFIGKLVRELALTRFAGNLQALLAAGLAIVQSMEIVAKTLGNMKYKKEILLMAKELEKGKTLQSAMAKRPKLFPSLTIQLTQVGETTGQLEEILSKIARFYEDRVNGVLNNLSTILEPVLLVIVGIAVGFIAVSVIGPMYELTNSFAD